ncbi:MAG: hypothetical protein QW156_01175 [Candidatus Aenigmatarchaeota archaeon]
MILERDKILKVKNFLINKKATTELFDVIVILIMILLAVMIYYFYIARYLNLHAIITENEARRHNINLGKALIGAKEFLVKNTTKTLNKYSLIQPNVDITKKYSEYLVFNITKLDEISENNLFASYSYPNTAHLLTILNLEDGKKWVYRGHGEALLAEGAIMNFFRCAIQNIRITDVLFQALFRFLPIGIVIEVGEGKRVSLDVFDLATTKTCFEKELSKSFSSSTYSMDAFPVILYDFTVDGYKIGRLVLQSFEVS